MDIKEIIKNLEHYNNWRRDNDNEYTMPEPKQIGITIDAAISELKKLLICDVVKPLKHKESLAFEEMLKDKYIRINDNLFQNRNYHYRKTRKELLEMYNAIGQLL